MRIVNKFSFFTYEVIVITRLLVFLLLLNSIMVTAQGLPASANSTTGNSGTGANIDVTYHRCEWRFHPDSPSAVAPAKYIKGKVITYFRTTQAGVSLISFDFNKSSFNNANLSVQYHGSSVGFSFPSSGAVNIITISLPVTLGNGVFDSISISYAGTPPAVNGQAEGFQKGSSASNNYFYTLSESYEDRDWWPCKSDMQDKIDSIDLVINVPNTFWAAAPGKLIDSSINGSNRTFIFQHRYPIPSYLVAIGIAKYQRYYRGVVTIGGNDVPVVYNLFPGKSGSTYTNILTALDKSMLEIQEFSNHFGDYPFMNEKHGYYEFGWAGGMEHQSFSAMGSGSLTSWSVIAHELGHQWFGDKVTFGTWNNLWLAEGFAKYMESLAAEWVPSLGQNPVTLRNSTKTAALATNTTPVYLSAASIANSNTIWTNNNDNAVYQRGAMVVSMLRALVGDTKFFQACRNYLSDPNLAYSSATTDDLRAHFESVLGGFNLTSFFNDFVMGTGNPDYVINWGTNNTTKKINIQVSSQSQSLGSTVSYFHAPIVLRLIGSNPATMDTTVVIYDNNGTLAFAGNGIGPLVSGNILTCALSFAPVTVTFDPFNQTLVTGSTTQLTSLSLPTESFYGYRTTIGTVLELVVKNAEQQTTAQIQRSSDGINFTGYANMKKQREELGEIYFKYIDNTLSEASTYYRALIVSPAGVEQYSRVILLKDRNKNNSRVYPNPASEKVNVSLSRDLKLVNPVVRLINQQGQVVIEVIPKSNDFELEVYSLPEGTYQLLLSINGVFSNLNRIIIQR